MKDRLQEFFQDLTIFSADLISSLSRQKVYNALSRFWRNIRQDNYRKIPLFLTVAVHLGVLLFSIAAPFIMTAKRQRIPEVYTVNLYNIQEAAPVPPVEKRVKVTTSVPKKTVSKQPLKTDAVSLSPIRQRLAKERKEKEARKREKELQIRRLEQVRLNLLKEQAENEAEQAEKELAEAKKEAAAKIADLYKAADYASDRREPLVDATGTSNRQGEIDRQKLEVLDRYRGRITDHIAPYWQLPELQEWDENLRAVIVMHVKRDGTVTNSYFETRSNNLRFNQYAMKAIENAQPLPPFPIDFHEKSEEIAVTFSPGGLF